ncbi:MmcQ/YjbR family DNA-binding protein [Parasulfitobacter algicola]|uniref:MmcQ/YjbR family DNA-binding protein n=1 Tax=Parasulfitobacter algicola TaxID=2614809 RepID=A0ABX2IV14_9RHOB|nr:MmcQ/YjbR family DNA-binding protein [Sulfitobacter algicola]NSX54111.1 MmcQ/YjbR family DNA-binding protein [Sulfitobacter algicola]
MTLIRQDADTICAGFPGAIQAHPPELVSWKVGGKMFACFGGERDMNGVSVKCPDVDTATMLIDTGTAIRAPYFHKSWVRLPFDTTTKDEMVHRLGVSYDVIRKSLPKSVRDPLPARKVS